MREGSLVLYKTRPARVARSGEKLDLEISGGENQRVRPKDVELLHAGPLRDRAELEAISASAPPAGDVVTAWQILAGDSTSLGDLAELVFGAYSPATAWAAWQLVADGLYFHGSTEVIRTRPTEEVEARLSARAARAREKETWNAFAARVSAGKTLPGDERFLKDVEALASGRSNHSRVLADLGAEESPESAHSVLLQTGYWDETVDPYPGRSGLTMTPPAGDLPPLRDEPRLDLTHLPAFAIDDAETTTPDDAVSLEGDRLWVHVADAAALIAPDSAADMEARARGSAIYLPETSIPMIPDHAIQCLGLGLADISPALSFGIDLGVDGGINGIRVEPSWVRVTRLTYEEAERRLEESPLKELARLAETLRAWRASNGAISIDMPEVEAKVIAGEVVLRRVAPLQSRSLVQAAMILAGAAVAQLAVEMNIPVPFATQEAPAQPNQPGTLAEMYAAIRTFRPRQYHVAVGPHAGLGLPAYVQVTSPLRRYLDLVVHQQLRANRLGQAPLAAGAVLERIGAAEAVLGSVRRAEQLADRHWTLVYLRRHPAWRGTGVLVSKRGLSGRIILPELALETQLHLPADLPLDSLLSLRLMTVDLAHLDAHFRLDV